MIGFLNKRNKLQELRDLGPLTPISAARYQASRNYPWKFEWTSVLSDRLFLDVIGGNWYNFFPLDPTDQYGFASNVVPGRIDTATNQRTGYNDAYQDQKRYKPQVYVAMNYFKDGWKGSHDFKFGYDWKRDRRLFGRAQPGNIFYRDLNSAVNELELYNSPNTSQNDVVYNAAYLSDTWKVTNRMTINAGVRYEHYVDSFPEQSFTPDGHSMLANWPADDQPGRARPLPWRSWRRSRSRRATVSTAHSVSPRLGFAYDLTGDNRTVLKGFAGRYLLQLGRHAGRPRKPGRQRAPALSVPRSERQPPARRTAGARTVPLDAGRRRLRQRRRQHQAPVFAGALQLTSSARSRTGLSGRFSYVYKNVRDEWVEIDPTREAAMTIPFSVRRHRRRRRRRHRRRQDAGS